MSNAAILASRFARRPLLIEPGAAQALFSNLFTAELPSPREAERGLGALMSKIGFGGKRSPPPPPIAGEANAVRRPAAYAPLWAQQTYGDPADEGFGWSLFNGVAAMEIDGTLFARSECFWWFWFDGYDRILATMREALADARVSGLFVRVSSPGGVVSDDLSAISAFMRAARASAGGKPIWVYADMACSAAYWLAAPADRVIGPSVAAVGSIGACMLHEDAGGALEKAGIRITGLKFGENKLDGAWWESLSAAAQTDFQAQVDQCGRNFVADVAASRPSLTPEALLATQARVFLGQHDDKTRSGLDLGFLDAVMGEQDAFAELVAHVTPASKPSSSKEAALANPNRTRATKPAKRPHAHAKPAATTAQVDAAAPDEGYEDCETCDGTGSMPDGTDCADCEGSGQVLIDPEDEINADAQAAANSRAISASEEAKAHPQLALAAINSGQTLAQFQASVAAVAAAPKASKLDGAMASAARLGPDAAVVEKQPISATDIYASRALAMKKAR